MKGVVKWFNETKGFGFITGDDDKEYFVFYQDIQDEGFKTLEENENVEFEPGEGPKGLKAIQVMKT